MLINYLVCPNDNKHYVNIHTNRPNIMLNKNKIL